MVAKKKVEIEIEMKGLDKLKAALKKLNDIFSNFGLKIKKNGSIIDTTTKKTLTLAEAHKRLQGTLSMKALEKTTANLKRLNHAITKTTHTTNKFSTSIEKLRPTLMKNGMIIDKNGIIYDKITKKTLTVEMAHKRLRNAFGEVGVKIRNATMKLNRFSRELDKTKLKTNSAKDSLGRFKMELLGIMFFGMAMAGMFMGILQPAMDTFGIFDLITNALKVGLIPTMEKIQPIIQWLAEAFMDSPDWFKGMVGGIAVVGAVAGTFLFLAGQLALGLDSIGKWTVAHKKFVKGLKNVIKAIVKTTIALGKYLIQLTRMIAMKIAGAFKSLVIGLKNARKGAVAARTGMMGLNMAMLPIIIVILAIAAIMAFFVLAWKNDWGNIRKHFETFKEGFMNYIEGMKMVLGGFIDFIVGVFTGDWKKAIDGLKKIWEGLKKIFIDGFGLMLTAGKNFIVDLVNEVLGKMPDWFKKMFGIDDMPMLKVQISDDSIKLPEIKTNLQHQFEGTSGTNLYPQSQSVTNNYTNNPEITINGNFEDKQQQSRIISEFNTIMNNEVKKLNIDSKKTGNN